MAADDLSLTPTSYIVLGLVERSGTATPYELKQTVQAGIANFWSVPHSQLYSEPDRLTANGLLECEQEPVGLRRKRYSLTDRGRSALEEWRRMPAVTLPEIRDESLLKLFFGADPRAFARVQRDAHGQKLAEYERVAAEDLGAGPPGPRHALRAGLGHEREWVRFWSELADE
jgi:PadR family transcriptional regulator AphA